MVPAHVRDEYPSEEVKRPEACRGLHLSAAPQAECSEIMAANERATYHILERVLIARYEACECERSSERLIARYGRKSSLSEEMIWVYIE